MAIRAEYLTKISDYNFETKQEVLRILSRQNMPVDVLAEKIRIPSAYQFPDELPIDTKTAWRISPYKKKISK